MPFGCRECRRRNRQWSMINQASRRGPGEGYQVGLQQQDQLFAGEATQRTLLCSLARFDQRRGPCLRLYLLYQSGRLVVLPFQPFSTADTRMTAVTAAPIVVHHMHHHQPLIIVIPIPSSKKHSLTFPHPSSGKECLAKPYPEPLRPTFHLPRGLGRKWETAKRLPISLRHITDIAVADIAASDLCET